jgi:hypothetical protein
VDGLLFNLKSTNTHTHTHTHTPDLLFNFQTLPNFGHIYPATFLHPHAHTHTLLYIKEIQITLIDIVYINKTQ